MSDPALIAEPLFGLRTWRVQRGPDGERLAGPHRSAPWPQAGAWLEATCGAGGDHPAPDPGCHCGIHAWHPSRAAARTVVAGRRDVPGVVEATGTVELHAEGFRAARARPCVLFALPGRNLGQLERLAAAHCARLVPVADADALLAWCRAERLGLGERAVAAVLGEDELERARLARRRERRQGLVRLAAAVLVGGALVGGGLALAQDPPGERSLYGRTGEVRVHRP